MPRKKQSIHILRSPLRQQVKIMKRSILHLGPAATFLGAASSRTITFAADDLAASSASVTATQTIHLPTDRPHNAFTVPPDFVSVGFESAFLPDYDNTFSTNLVNSIQQRL